MLVSSLDFLKLWHLLGFFDLIWVIFSYYLVFFLSTSDSHGTQNLALLKRDISSKYKVTVRNKFDTLQEISENVLQMTNMKTSSLLTRKQQQNAHEPNKMNNDDLVIIE